MSQPENQAPPKNISPNDIVTIELARGKTNIVFADKDQALTVRGSHSLVCDKNIVSFLPTILYYLVIFPSGEACKTKECLFTVVDALLEQGIERSHTLVAIGGGTVCDVSSFAASIVYRGIPLILIPTTLLSMVDAAIGGKTGINYYGYKNMVGSFYQASEIRICPEFLSSLPKEEYKSGLAEVIKAAMIGDSTLLSILEEQAEAVKACDINLLRSEILPRAIKVKACIVQEDEREYGVRRLLNLGHTFAHALESVLKFSGVRHGEAVAWGIRVAVAYASKTGILDHSHAAYINDLLDVYGYEKRYAVGANELISAMKMDKKRDGERIILVLPQAKEEIVTAPANERLLREILPAFITASFS